MLPNSSIKIVGNKKDLLTEDEIKEVLESLSVTCNITTSAKTGENVEALFLELGKELV